MYDLSENFVVRAWMIWNLDASAQTKASGSLDQNPRVTLQGKDRLGAIKELLSRTLKEVLDSFQVE
ncbi:hypothetical protein E4U30_004697 [Claviceps sp. LM220 group G6]|nr:hypothetical protein E4U30_004697 [Claviceps sp. LM220 group G6]